MGKRSRSLFVFNCSYEYHNRDPTSAPTRQDHITSVLARFPIHFAGSSTSRTSEPVSQKAAATCSIDLLHRRPGGTFPAAELWENRHEVPFVGRFVAPCVSVPSADPRVGHRIFSISISTLLPLGPLTLTSGVCSSTAQIHVSTDDCPPGGCIK
jgi:hypothetical protein